MAREPRGGGRLGLEQGFGWKSSPLHSLLRALRPPGGHRMPCWEPAPYSMGSAPQVAHATGEVSSVGAVTGLVPEPACARPSPGARLPCQGTPVSGARQTVPVPRTWKSLTFQAAGAALLGLVQLVSAGQG